MITDMLTHGGRTAGAKSVTTNATARWATATLGAMILVPFTSALFLMPAEAQVTCWPSEEVIAAHAEQGDNVVVTYRSWVQEGMTMIIYQDPADGVVTEIGILPNGAACLVNAGEGLGNQVPSRSVLVPNTQ